MGAMGDPSVKRFVDTQHDGCQHTVRNSALVKKYEESIQLGYKLDLPFCHAETCNLRAEMSCLECGPDLGYCKKHLAHHALSRADDSTSAYGFSIPVSHEVFASTSPIPDEQDHYCLWCIKCDDKLAKGGRWIRWMKKAEYNALLGSKSNCGATQGKRSRDTPLLDSMDPRRPRTDDDLAPNNNFFVSMQNGKKARRSEPGPASSCGSMMTALQMSGFTPMKSAREIRARMSSIAEANKREHAQLRTNSTASSASTIRNVDRTLDTRIKKTMAYPRDFLPEVISEEKRQLVESLAEMDNATREETLKCLSREDISFARHFLPTSPLIGEWSVLRDGGGGTTRFKIVMTKRGLQFIQHIEGASPYAFLVYDASSEQYVARVLVGHGAQLDFYSAPGSNGPKEIRVNSDPSNRDKLVFADVDESGRTVKFAVREGGREELSKWARAGLRNNGNTCYINGVIQLLSAVPHLLEPGENVTLGPIASELTRLCGELRNEKGIEKTDKLLELIQRKLKPDHAMYNSFNQQHDAEEFLRTLLTAIQAESSTDASASEVISTPRSSSSRHSRIDSPRSSKRTAPETIVKNLAGTVVFELTCGHCDHKLHKEQDLLGAFQLNIPSTYAEPSGPSIPELLRAAMEADEVSDYKCLKCNRSGNSRQEWQFKDMPSVLVLHLVRTGWDPVGGNAKVQTPVRCTEKFEWNIVNDSTTTKMKFELRAVLNHQGDDAVRGHYTCYRRKNDSMWVLADDSLTRDAEKSEIDENPTAATMLIYQSEARQIGRKRRLSSRSKP